MTSTPMKAISAKCKDCIYDPGAGGTWREQVELCPSGNCPLFDYRPISGGKTANYKPKDLSEEERAAIRERFSQSMNRES